VENSWAKWFSEYVFPLIDESLFSVLYCEDNGRPNTPINVIVGALILKELFGLTDEELFEAIICDARYRFALHLMDTEDIPFSDRTLSRFRERVVNYLMETGEDLIARLNETLGSIWSELLKLSKNLKRMDSLMVSSSCKSMGRLELIYTCVSNMVKLFVKEDKKDVLSEHLLKYADKSDKNSVCYRLKDEEVTTKLEEVVADAFVIFELAENYFIETKEYRILKRMLGDQTKDGKLKPNNEISSTSLQNPSDEDATYRRKAGKDYHGFVLNAVEDCGNKTKIITNYDFQANTHSDVEFGAEYIDYLGSQEEKVTVVSDGGYAADENFKSAASNNIDFITTSLLGKKASETIAEFEIVNDTIISCPEGQKPIDSKYKEEKEEYQAHFCKEICETCPRRDECPVVIQKKKALVKITKVTINRAIYSSKLSTEEYKAYARIRNGVEGIPSVLRRRYHIDNIPVRGLLRLKLWVGFKIAALNVSRVIKSKQMENKEANNTESAIKDSSVSVVLNFIALKIQEFMQCYRNMYFKPCLSKI
jgi:hypothetical protein